MPTILPFGKQQYCDAAGTPLAGGSVYFYTPSTTTPKTTWSDSAGTIPNANPVVLDSAGQAIVWGYGSYRQLVKDSTGVTVWDQVVSVPDVAAQLTTADITYTSASTGAVSRVLTSRLDDWISVSDFPVVGNGITNDSAALQSWLDACAGKSGYLTPGTYLCSNLTIASNTTIFSAGPNVAILKLAGTNAHILSATNQNGFSISGIGFDGDNLASTLPLIELDNCNSWYFCNNIVENWSQGVPGLGLQINAGTGWWVDSNTFTYPVPKNTQNQAINISNTLGQPTGKVVNNRITGSGILANCRLTLFSQNHITGTGFGACLGIDPDPNVYRNIITNNYCADTFGTDSNGFPPNGIENWGSDSVISGNVCVSNSGNGIGNGGQDCTVSDNVCVSNGKVSGSGINSAYADANFNAANSIYTGNRCYDVLGAGGTQVYGYFDASASNSRITVRGNNFTGNKTAPMSIAAPGNNMDVTGPALFTSSSFTVLAIVGSSYGVYTIAFTAAAFGDVCEATWNTTLQGLTLTAYVSSAGNIACVFANATGGTVTLGAGTVQITVRKPPNYAAY